MSGRDRYARQVALFAADGQHRLRATKVVVVGAGGVGSPVIQQLALLGVAAQVPIDRDTLQTTNRNRVVSALESDADGTPKTGLARRLSESLNSTVIVDVVNDSVISEAGFAAIKAAHWVIGCVDRDGVRQVLLELCAAYDKAYIDIATEVTDDPFEYGGRIVTTTPGRAGCLSCFDELDRNEVERDLAGPQGAAQRAAIYGVPVGEIEGSGPSVGCINGVVANLAVVEFMAAVTGLREPNRVLRFRGTTGKVTSVTSEPHSDCYYCIGMRGKREAADVEHYLRDGVGAWL
jgi:molybdopterin/thiamine biosynthesis adenylyltransferase